MPTRSRIRIGSSPCMSRPRAMDTSYRLSPKSLFRDDDDGVDTDARGSDSPPTSDLNSSTDSGVVRSAERSPSVPVLKVLPVPRQETPPYKRIRALRLFGSPQTPKTLLQRSEAPSTRDVVGSRQRTHLVEVGANVNPFSPAPTTPPPPLRSKRPRQSFSLLRSVFCAAQQTFNAFDAPRWPLHRRAAAHDADELFVVVVKVFVAAVCASRT